MYERGEGLLSHMLIRPLLTRTKLTEIKRKAIRRGVWFTALNKMERGCVDITTKIVKSVQSTTLAKALTTIVKKLLCAMESKVERLIREVGHKLAFKISSIAQEWGYVSASKWATDPKFMRYLTIIKVNTAEEQKT